jgi:hypothetical protein
MEEGEFSAIIEKHFSIEQAADVYRYVVSG